MKVIFSEMIYCLLSLKSNRLVLKFYPRGRSETLKQHFFTYWSDNWSQG